MRVPGIVFASRSLLPDEHGGMALQQVANVATLPGIVRQFPAKRRMRRPRLHAGHGPTFGRPRTFGPSRGDREGRSNEIVRRKPDLAPAFEIEITAQGELAGAAGYARRKIGGLGRLTHQPVLFARIKLTKHPDPAVQRPVVAQANIDVNGRLVRAQVQGVSAREAIDGLEARLRHKLERVAEHWEARRGELPAASPHEWRHGSEDWSGVIRGLVYVNHADMGSYRDAIDAFQGGSDSIPDITAHRRLGRVK